MAHRSGVTIVDNEINAAGTADGIRATGALLDVRRNTFNVQGTGAILQNYDSGFAVSVSCFFFSPVRNSNEINGFLYSSF